LALAFHGGFFFLPEDGKRTSVLALPMNGVYPLSYDEDDDLEQLDITNYAQGADINTPLSSSNYGYSVSPDISVQQNVTQQNICSSSNTAYCYNEVDNDFNVNPP